MLRRIKKRKRNRVFPQRSTGAVAAISAFVVFWATESVYADEGYASVDSTENSVTLLTGDEHSESRYMLDTTPADLQRIFDNVWAPPTGSGCDHWADFDSMAGMLVPIPGAAWLLVGDRGEARGETSGWSIRNLQRKYRLIHYRRSGSPLEGEIVFLVPQADVEAERRCVEHLRGITVRWFDRAGDPDSVANAGKMTVQAVRFARAAVTGPDGESADTGDTVVKLSLTEGWISMAWREMKAQGWGIAAGMVAGILLTILTSLTRIGGEMLSKIRKLVVLNRSRRKNSAVDDER